MKWSKKKRARLLLSTVLLMVIMEGVGPSALADSKTRKDADDAAGKLDVQSVQWKHSSGRLLIHHLTTYEAWTNDVFQKGSYIFFSFKMGDRRRQLFVSTSEDGTLFGQMTDPDTGRIVGFAKVWRPDERSLQVEFPRRFLGRSVSRYKWEVTTNFHEEGHPECGTQGSGVISCPDRVPDTGRLAHDL